MKENCSAPQKGRQQFSEPAKIYADAMRYP